jgi:hypothetical protein
VIPLGDMQGRVSSSLGSRGSALDSASYIDTPSRHYHAPPPRTSASAASVFSRSGVDIERQEVGSNVFDID